MIAQCPEDMEPERFCLCLMTLLEAGLLQSAGGEIYGASSSSISGKADLEATEIIKTLRAV